MAQPRTVGVHEAKTQFSRLLREVEAGEEILVARGGEVVARLSPARPAARVAQSRGMFRGQFRLPDDFEDDDEEMGDLFGLPA